MIDKENFKGLLHKLGFLGSNDVFYKEFPDSETSLKVDFRNKKLIYPEDKGFIVNERTTCNFSKKENFVVFECVHRLFTKGYKPQHIELEPRWQVGHGASGGRADVMVKDNSNKSLLIIECKTAGREFEDAWKKTLLNGGQLFSYVKQAGSTQFVCLYASDFIDEKVIPNYYVITLKDNEKLLEELSDKKPLSYREAKSLEFEDIFKAWKETYSQDYATKGIFEDDIPAYQIGKTKYSLKDLSTINSNDIQGKYHQFATILRQHNVSGRENAFDKLVNLFLCKIVDETNNPDELRFYWKGVAYDSFFELQDRLQKLYQEGMKRFLGEDVTYIDNEAIDDAFRFFKKDPDATRETIKKYFRELKFFTNNDFAFIDVHNEKLFYQNSAVLLKIVKMLQDIQLKTEVENQFLGDMFEGFLDQGVKQSEGQFFTPMPIVKFILKSLPLDQIIDETDQIPKVIDYACGAGHFLNEYAKEIKPIIEEEKETEVEKYYENITGIEKEYRLSKVAKVSAFMYGQDEIKIIYSDALASTPFIKNNDYSLLVANPPYSVKGFLETIPEIDRKKYKLIETIEEKSYPNNNSIETFFIERTKQLLKPGGVAGIIVPSSILTKGKSKSTSKSTNVYVATREILLKYFDIVAIAEFGSGTFGKTGTNTVTLFIRRKKEYPAPADHFLNRVNAWFNGDKTKDGVFEDEHLIKKYCNHLEINFDDYQTLLTGNPSKELLKSDIFIEYQKEFDRWAKIMNRKKQRTFRALSKEEKETELQRHFVTYLVENEKDKLLYFVLASKNPQDVLIIKSPPQKSNIKKFLGYEWSSAKGKEGIKYLGNISVDKVIEDEEVNVAMEEEDKRVLSNILNLNNIKTPLYDPADLGNPEKINYLIHENFIGNQVSITENLTPYVIQTSLTDMIDFFKVDFNKGISTTPNINLTIESKWPQNKISKLLDFEYGKNLPEESRISGTYPVVGSNGIVGTHNTYLVEGPCIVVGRKGSAGQINWIENHCTPIDTTFYVVRKSEDIDYYYAYIILSLLGLNKLSGGTGVPGLTRDDVYRQKIPLPKPAAQRKIVRGYKALNKELTDANNLIVSENARIEELFNEALSQAIDFFKLSDDRNFDISIGKRVLKKEINFEENGIPVFSANVFEPFGHIRKSLLEDFKTDSILWGIDGDWGVNLLQKGIPFYPTDHCGVLRILNPMLESKYVALALQKEGERVRFSRHNRASIDSIKGLTIKAPTKEIQGKLVKDIEKSEKKIKESKELISDIAKRQEQLIKKYL